MRVVGLDLGTRRIGVAVSDPSGTVASPHAVIDRGPSAAAARRAIADLVREVGAERVVVGMPLTLAGRVGSAGRAALDEVEELKALIDVPVETHDERLTTVSAERSLIGGGVRRGARRQIVDKVAAAVMLQSWLDSRRHEP